ncbi:hypothetical protein GGP41_003910 [Bipolaris sorokiniana]|uniref:Uncharacterized protein n=1 Tax=Cochliobolus sativus TaxID=45130 RepID=A0A8H5Z9R4_COCSA|nr:hypothetical protein GGP41_003910 [Bipolaris sorokiniana]
MDLWKARLDFQSNATVNITMGQWALLWRGEIPEYHNQPPNVEILALAGHLSLALNYHSDIVSAIGGNTLPIIQKLAASKKDEGDLVTFLKYRITSYLNRRVEVTTKEMTYVGTFKGVTNVSTAMETLSGHDIYDIRVDDWQFPLSIAEVANGTTTFELYKIKIENRI